MEKSDILDALLMMANQYLTIYYDGKEDEQVLDHAFMSAGEHTLDLLEKLGYVKPWDKNPCYYVFTEKANE